MLVLVTGLPGNGKTLFALNWVKAKAEKEGRPVYYSGISDLRLPWIEFEFKEWPKLPANAIIVVDEAQRELRPRMHGTAVPEHVAQLETHRHKGVDIVLITQHPMLIDANARRLVGLHFHLVRKFGTQASTVHEWASVKEHCDKSRDDSTRHDFIFPKASYGWYKSAEVHTHKARIPARVWWLVAVPVLLVGCAYAAFSWFSKKLEPAKPTALPTATLARVDARSSGGAAAAAGAPVLTVAQYLEAHTPRVPGLAYTAPVFDSVTVPVVAPYPAACGIVVRYVDGEPAPDCRCYSQQATRLEVPDTLCRSIVERGFFVSWRQDGPQGAQSSGTAPESHRHALDAPAPDPGGAVAGLTPRAPAPKLPVLASDGLVLIPAGDGRSPAPRPLPGSEPRP